MSRGVLAARSFRLAMIALALGCGPLAGPLLAQGRVEHVPGIVRTEQGEPLVGATVVAENPRATPHLFATTTDGNGAFWLIGLDAGPWTITAGKRGYVPSQVKVTLVKGTSGPYIELAVARDAWEPPPPVESGSLAGVDVFRLQTAIQNADTLMRAQQYDQAIVAYRDVLAKAPALTRTNIAIGDAWRMKKDYEQAIGAYRAALAGEPGNEMALVRIATTEVERGDAAAAEKLLAEAASGPKPGRETLCTLGDIKLAQGQADQAAAWYRKAAAADPAWARPVLKLGLMAASEQNAEAASLLEKVVRLAPGSPDANEAARALASLRK